MATQSFTDLEISILHHAEVLIRNEFKIEAKRFFHYTDETSAEAILNTQTFHSSFIRSSSDSLEFSNPMAACRDCVCLTQNFFGFQKFPFELFKHFNEQAIDPSARAYFISLSGNSKSTHLQSMYGNARLEFKLNTEITDFKSYGFLINCKYVDDTKTEVFRLLKRWRDEVFERALRENGIQDAQPTMNDWFYTLMQFCNTISVGIKQRAFENEQETRVVTFSKNPDLETDWHKPRGTKPIAPYSKSLIKREFLPLNLNAMGIIVARDA